MPINIRLYGKIRWEMGRKDVPEYPRSGHPAESGVSAVFLRRRRKQGSGLPEYLPFSGAGMRSEKGILYRMNRSIQVEGAVGVLKNDYEFQRFLLRGKTKVKLEILLLCMGYNLNKLHAKIQTPSSF